MNFNLPNADAIMGDINMPLDMDENGEVSCDVEEHKDELNCPICAHNSDDASVIQQMNDIEVKLTGTVSPEEIYRVQHQLYETQVRAPLLRQNKVCPEITLNDIRAHYQKHRLNLRDIISKEILFVNTMQVHFRKSQIATKCLKDGRKTLNMKGVDQWIKLSKHKLDLIKYLNGPLAKKAKTSGTKGIKPYEFT
jgi:hypothetical protein